MYLKSLEIHGFKSFPSRTVMTFEPGTTVVVGPNGSGKSNISDAMRWVLGESNSRNIRGTKMEDVIFGGTDTRRPMGYAEVSVCFDNTDPNFRFDTPYDEVTVTRRYFRSGTSEYLINQKPCLQKDVHKLFMDTGIGRDGYSIIGQGKISEIVSKKSEERRAIFEDAAGIAKYRSSKHEAQLKLDATTRNMETTYVQISMYEEQLAPLEKEAEKARRGEAIKEEKKAVDVALWLYDTSKIFENVTAARLAYETQKEELEVLTSAVQKLYDERTELEEERTGSLYRSEGLQKNINEIIEEIHRIDNRLGVIETEISHANSLIAQSEGRTSELQRQRTSIQGEVAGYVARIRELEGESHALADDKLGVLSEQQGIMQRLKELDVELNASLTRLEKLESDATNLRVSIDVLKKARQSDTDRSVSLQKDIEEYEKTGERLQQEAALCERNAAGYKSKIEEQDKLIAERNLLIGNLTMEKEDLTEEIGTLRVSYNTKLTRANDLQRMADQMEGFTRSVKTVMSEYEAGNIAGVIYGPLSQLVTIEKAYVTAIESALGSSTQNIVTDTDITAKHAIEALKRTERGKATFLPVSTIRSSSETDEIRAAEKLKGYVSRADKLVSCDEKFRAIVEWLLLRTVVFDTLENAVAAAKELRHKVRLVTLDGQIMNVGGSMTGGSVKNEGTGLLSRNGEIVALREEAQRINDKIVSIEDRISKLDKDIINTRDEIKDAEQNKELMYSMARTQFAALDTANARFAANESTLEKLREEFDSILGMQSINDSEIENKEHALASLETEIKNLREYRTEVSVRLGATQEEKEGLQERVQEFDIRIAEIARDIQAVNMMMSHSNERIAELDADIREQETRISSYRLEITSLIEERDIASTSAASLESERTKLTEAREGLASDAKNFDRRLTEINGYIKIKENEKNNLSRSFYEAQTAFEQLTERQETLSTRLHDEYGMSYEDAVEANYPPVTSENEAEMRQTAISCYNRLRNIGGYSPTAITDYLETKAKYDEVNGQYLDLKTSFNNLNEIIRKLEEEMARTFVTSFEQINENFGIVFRELFGGGSAQLTLTNPEDVLNSGIEIKATPPGKKIDKMSLLSGGESSFVAIALLFSILKLHPTPFCILDEVEAALDEVNVFRFGEYIKRFCNETQFILITHRRGTMQIADRLYGVTMPERGISKIICVDVSEIDARKNELTDTD